MKLRVSVYDGSGALIGGELERKRKKSAKPLWARGDVDDLIRRLVGDTQDEGAGHAFHGNQYVQVAGQNVEVPSKGSVKEKLHHLFAQGHKFTLKELAALLGQNEVTLRGRLSEIKKAAPAGGLILEKVGEHYSIKKKTKTQEELDIEAMEQAFPEPAKAPEPVAAPTPAPAPVAPPVAPPVPVPEPKTLAEKVLSDPGVFDPPATPMTKNAADQIYGKKIDDWMDLVKGQKWPADVDPGAIKAVAEGWKNTKANAMAEWAANTTGQPQKAKILGVFKADEQLVKSLMEGKLNHGDVLAQWKQNTKNEKLGTWPPDPFKEALAKEAALKAAEALSIAEKTKYAAVSEALKEHAPHFPPIPGYVPEHYTGVAQDDFLGSSPEFSKEIGQLKSKLQQGHTDAVGNKIGVQKALEDRLKDSKAFQALRTQRSTNGSTGSLEAQLISAWAGSSGDHQPVSVANQLSIRDAFAMHADDVAMDALYLITKTKSSEDDVFSAAALTLQCKYGTPAEKATFRAGMRDFALAQYHNTQEHLSKMGITHLYLARGSGGGVGIEKDNYAATYGNMKLQPASSFSANYGTAAGSFSKGDSVYMVKVPASQVLSSYVTGFGCTNEHEVVVLAHPKTEAVRVSASHGSSLSSAVSHVASTMKNAPPPSAYALEKLEAMEEAKAKQALVHAKAGGPPPTVPKYHKGTIKGYTKPAYEAAKKGDVEAAKQIHTKWVAEGSKGSMTKQYMETIVAHAEVAAAHKEAVKKAKAEIKAETKAAPKPKPVVHVHVHTPSPNPSLSASEHAFAKAAAKEVPEWYEKHPMHNEQKYYEMVAKGKTPIQIKHYYGSLLHASKKKQAEALSL